MAIFPALQEFAPGSAPTGPGTGSVSVSNAVSCSSRAVGRPVYGPAVVSEADAPATNRIPCFFALAQSALAVSVCGFMRGGGRACSGLEVHAWVVLACEGGEAQQRLPPCSFCSPALILLLLLCCNLVPSPGEAAPPDLSLCPPAPETQYVFPRYVRPVHCWLTGNSPIPAPLCNAATHALLPLNLRCVCVPISVAACPSVAGSPSLRHSHSPSSLAPSPDPHGRLVSAVSCFRRPIPRQLSSCNHHSAFLSLLPRFPDSLPPSFPSLPRSLAPSLTHFPSFRTVFRCFPRILLLTISLPS